MSLETIRRNAAKTLRDNAKVVKGIGVEISTKKGGAPSVVRLEQGVEIFTTPKKVS